VFAGEIPHCTRQFGLDALLASGPYSMKRAVVVMAAVVERAAGCRVRGAVDLENRVGGFELEGFGHVRRGGDRLEAVGRFDDGLVVLAVG
jgi:hypothetical protein